MPDGQAPRASPSPSRVRPDEVPHVDGVEVDVAHALEEFGGPGVGQGLGEVVAPGLVLGLQGAELGQGRGPPGRPRSAVLRALEGPDGLAGGAALPGIGAAARRG